MTATISLVTTLAVSSSLVGMTLLAILLPTGFILVFLAVTRWGHTRRFQIASAVTFLVLALWYLGSVLIRSIRGDLGALFGIELILAIGFGFQAWWVWKAKL